MCMCIYLYIYIYIYIYIYTHRANGRTWSTGEKEEIVSKKEKKERGVFPEKDRRRHAKRSYTHCEYPWHKAQKRRGGTGLVCIRIISSCSSFLAGRYDLARSVNNVWRLLRKRKDGDGQTCTAPRTTRQCDVNGRANAA